MAGKATPRGGRTPGEHAGELHHAAPLAESLPADAQSVAPTQSTNVASISDLPGPDPLASRKPQPAPLVLRLAPGYAVLAVAGLLGLIGLSYWVGYTRGDQDRRDKVIAQQRAEQEIRERTALQLGQVGASNATDARRPSSAGSGITPSAAAATIGSPTSSGAVIPALIRPEMRDPRQPGLNYFVLIHYPEDEALRLVGFLRAAGVEAIALSSHNTRLCKVVALTGFTREELGGARQQAYEQRLRDLGRQWKKTRAGAGDLGDMYPELYKGD